MSTVIASYSPVCRTPVLLASSGTRPASRSWKPAAAFPASVAVKCRRPLSVTYALEKQLPAFSILPTALLHPVSPTDGTERWDIREEGNHVKLWFQVPGLTEDDLEISVTEDMLEIKRKGADDDDRTQEDVHGLGSFRVRLLMTKEYDTTNVKAELKDGMLVVTVGKFEQIKKEINIMVARKDDPAALAREKKENIILAREQSPAPRVVTKKEENIMHVRKEDPAPPKKGFGEGGSG